MQTAPGRSWGRTVYVAHFSVLRSYSHTSYSPCHAPLVWWLYAIHPYSLIQSHTPYSHTSHTAIHPIHRPSGRHSARRPRDGRTRRVRGPSGGSPASWESAVAAARPRLPRGFSWPIEELKTREKRDTLPWQLASCPASSSVPQRMCHHTPSAADMPRRGHHLTWPREV